MKIKELMIFPNGGMAVFDEAGRQVGELQKSWMEMIFEFLESRGVHPPDIERIRIFSTEGPSTTVKAIKVPDGWNWSIK